VSELGLFPLGMVLLPGERVPLHIFEPRYRELIGECLDTGATFGLLFADDKGVRGVGTYAAVVELLERLPDGRMNVVVEGRDRFRLLELTSGRSFHTGVVADEEDDEDPAAEEDVERALELFRELRTLVEADVDDPEPDAALSFALAARVDFGPATKQQLLESRSERERLARVMELLKTAVANAKVLRDRAERASRNGHLRST
jgi:ATP-dependent Lon protease